MDYPHTVHSREQRLVEVRLEALERNLDALAPQIDLRADALSRTTPHLLGLAIDRRRPRARIRDDLEVR